MPGYRIAITLFLAVLPLIGLSNDPLPNVPKEEWPKHDPPTLFHGAFEVPEFVWKVHGGHFIAYDAGEWGGAFFFQREGTEQLQLLLKDHVGSVTWFEGGAYVVAGGLAHEREHGAVYFLSIDENLQWVSRKLLTTWQGIPTVITTGSPGTARIAIVKTSFGIGEQEEKTTVATFSVASDGDLQYLGTPDETKKANKPE